MGARKRVFVGLSGGVDSAVSAALLCRAGYDVTGVFIETWHPEFLPCTWRDDRREAMRVAAHLKIPFISLDLREQYRTEVGELFIREYEAGRTPNPDVLCNRAIKFGGFASFARLSGADFIATGHYARIERGKEGYELHTSPDDGKDQSYFLWMLTQDDLAFIQFPLGNLTKLEVRKLARTFNLPNAERKDSQGICFLGAIDLPEFLSHFFPIKEGEVLNQEGTPIGKHKGAVLYTLGERHGFSVPARSPYAQPLVVIETNSHDNTIIVGPKESLPARMEYELERVNLLSVARGALTAMVRYHAEPIPCTLTNVQGVYKLACTVPVTIASGQSVVFYQGTRLIGGGIVCV